MSDLPFSVMMPYRATPDRKPLMEAVCKWWQDNFGVFPTLIDTNHEPFNLAACRNKCVVKSSTEIVIVTDADIICEISAIREAIQIVSTSGNTCIPFKKHNVLTEKGTKNYLAGQRLSIQPHIPYPSADGGILITTKTMWERHNGQDERFVGWGPEDVCWVIAYETLIGKLTRLDAKAWTMNHELAPRDVDKLTKTQLKDRYLEAQGDPMKMLDLIKGNREGFHG